MGETRRVGVLLGSGGRKEEEREEVSGIWGEAGKILLPDVTASFDPKLSIKALKFGGVSIFLFIQKHERMAFCP